MKDMGVRADDDTLRFYCIPFCDLNEPKLLIPRIQAVGYSVKELLTPAMAVLLSQNRVNDARKLSTFYEKKSICKLILFLFKWTTTVMLK